MTFLGSHVAATTRNLGIIEVYSRDINYLYRSNLVRNPNTPFHIIKRLATDSHYEVRFQVNVKFGDHEEIAILLRASQLYYELKR